MNKLEESKEMYDTIPIPKQLNEMVMSVIKEFEEKRDSEQECSTRNEEMRQKERVKKSGISAKRKIIRRWGVGIAASFLLATVIGVNTNQAFAMILQDIPIVGTFAKIVTIRSYSLEDQDKSITVDIPSLELISNDTNGLADEVNTEIFNMCSLYAEEALKRAEEYKEAFMETGGTQEEWEKHNIKIEVGYEIKNQSQEYVSFIVTGKESWSSAYSESKYYNLDLKNNRYISLQDMLGQDYIQIANKSIRAQIAEQQKLGKTFWSTEEGGFESITGDSRFYINETGNPVIVFDKYEIAPGYMGEVSFEIKKEK